MAERWRRELAERIAAERVAGQCDHILSERLLMIPLRVRGDRIGLLLDLSERGSCSVFLNDEIVGVMVRAALIGNSQRLFR